MSRAHRLRTSIGVLALAALWLPGAARADRAVVVGVERYASLPAGANQLKGCVDDARLMKTALERYGFVVTLLADAQATKRGILEALNKTSGVIGPNERFVFYFAGHGTDMPRPSLLPSDALEDRDTNHLTRDELYRAVMAVPARGRTVLLDSCFSGGMARSLSRLQRERPQARARYYPTRTTRGARSPVPVNNQDTNQNIAGSGDVCYYVAALGNEKAMEDNFNGAHHGVFTYFLVAQLDGKEDPWKRIHTAVKGKVVDFLFDWQHPTLSPALYLETPVFDSKNAEPTKTSPPPAPPTAWDTYNSDYPDPARVSVTMQPDKTTVVVGERFRFAARVGVDGYLVLLERDVEGRVYRLFPKNGRLDSARVRAGQVVRIPEIAYNADTPGTEHIKAILFTGRDKAAALLSALPKGETGVPLAGMKRLQEVRSEDAPFYTSEIAFEVAEKPSPAKPPAKTGALRAVRKSTASANSRRKGFILK